MIDETGPIGEILMKETADEMNIQLDKIPKSQIADFIYRIGALIPRKQQVINFKKIMLQEMKNIGVL